MNRGIFQIWQQIVEKFSINTLSFWIKYVVFWVILITIVSYVQTPTIVHCTPNILNYYNIYGTRVYYYGKVDVHSVYQCVNLFLQQNTKSFTFEMVKYNDILNPKNNFIRTSPQFHPHIKFNNFNFDYFVNLQLTSNKLKDNFINLEIPCFNKHTINNNTQFISKYLYIYEKNSVEVKEYLKNLHNYENHIQSHNDSFLKYFE